jgi:hypothetical protein
VGFCDGQKSRWGRFSPRTSVSPANLHSICFSTIIFTITRGCWHNRPGVAAVPIASHTQKKNFFQSPVNADNFTSSHDLRFVKYAICAKRSKTMYACIWQLFHCIIILRRKVTTSWANCGRFYLLPAFKTQCVRLTSGRILHHGFSKYVHLCIQGL